MIGPKKDKFTPRVVKCILLDHTPRKKGYKLYDYNNDRIIVSRDVVFYEQIFPFRTEICEAQNTEIMPLPIVPVSQDNESVPEISKEMNTHSEHINTENYSNEQD